MKTFISALVAAAVATTANAFNHVTNIRLNDARRSNAFFTVRSIKIPKGEHATSFSDKIHWKDQGWGNRKGAARFQVLRKGKVVLT